MHTGRLHKGIRTKQYPPGRQVQQNRAKRCRLKVVCVLQINFAMCALMMAPIGTTIWSLAELNVQIKATPIWRLALTALRPTKLRLCATFLSALDSPLYSLWLDSLRAPSASLAWAMVAQHTASRSAGASETHTNTTRCTALCVGPKLLADIFRQTQAKVAEINAHQLAENALKRLQALRTIRSRAA